MKLINSFVHVKQSHLLHSICSFVNTSNNKPIFTWKLIFGISDYTKNNIGLALFTGFISR